MTNMVQMGKPTPAIAALAVVAAIVGWTLTQSPADTPSRQEAAITTDCEAASSAPVRQPANAWTALAYCVVGAATLTKPDRYGLLGGFALVAAGSASFLFHATLTPWSAHLDGLAVAALAGALALWAWRHRVPLACGLAAIGAALGAAGWNTTATKTLAAIFGAAIAVRLLHKQSRRRALMALAAITLLAGGAALWLLGRSGAPWCRPESLLQAHAAWHLTSAAGLWVLIAWLRSVETGDTRRAALAS
jgi:hypothetical protein